MPQTNYYKTFQEIIENEYNIESYQRGYRWDENNVTDLLNDIFEGKLPEHYGDFFKDKTNSYIEADDIRTDLQKSVEKKHRDAAYSLQPLVVKKQNNSNVYNVIDGQQRLTTLYIIYKAICSMSDIKFPGTFKITYKSREGSADFLNNIKYSEPSWKNIDFDYMQQAFNTARNWLKNKNQAFNNLIIDREKYDESQVSSKLFPELAKYLRSKLEIKTRFIWDETDNDDEQRIFASRNSGKIELTDSELIKALLMNPDYYGDKVGDSLKDKQVLISEIWDIYENKLHEDEFWEFVPLTAQEKKRWCAGTRIDGVFLLFLKDKVTAPDPHEDKSLFKAMKKYVDQELDGVADELKPSKMEAIWREVCGVIDGIEELYADNELYNLLSLHNKTAGDDEIYKGYNSVLQNGKTQRVKSAKKLIREKLFGGGDANEAIKTIVKNTRLPDSGTIRKILLAYNVALINFPRIISDKMLENNTAKPKPPRMEFGIFFGKDSNFVGKNWHIEHIYATNEDTFKKDGIGIEEQAAMIEALTDDDGFCGQAHRDYIKKLHCKPDDNEYNDDYLSQWLDNYNAKTNKEPNKYIDIWKYIKLTQKTQELLYKYKVYKDISNVLDSPDFDKAAEDFLRSGELRDGNAFRLLKVANKDENTESKWDADADGFLRWDSEIDNTYKAIIENRLNPDEVKWHGYALKVDNPETFWTKTNFLQNYFREILRSMYDNTGLKDYSVGNHGPIKSDPIITDDSRSLFISLFKGTVYRIKEDFDDFFGVGEQTPQIDVTQTVTESADELPQDPDKSGKKTTKWSSLTADNTMGNFMLLSQRINTAYDYRDKNFNGKRKYFAENESAYLPVGTLRVLMGNFTDLDNPSEQWRMPERLKYIEDIIGKLTDYFGDEKNEG